MSEDIGAQLHVLPFVGQAVLGWRSLLEVLSGTLADDEDETKAETESEDDEEDEDEDEDEGVSHPVSSPNVLSAQAFLLWSILLSFVLGVKPTDSTVPSSYMGWFLLVDTALVVYFVAAVLFGLRHFFAVDLSRFRLQTYVLTCSVLLLVCSAIPLVVWMLGALLFG